MRMSDFDQRLEDRQRRMDRWMRVNAAIGFIVFVTAMLIVVSGLYLLVTSPEEIGAWAGRLVSGFEGR